jgi:hypothetical protein
MTVKRPEANRQIKKIKGPMRKHRAWFGREMRMSQTPLKEQTFERADLQASKTCGEINPY